MTIPRGLGGLLAVLTLCATATTVSAQNPPGRPATPVDPIDAIIKAFDSYSIVALGEGPHGNEQGHDFRLRLLRDPRFAATVNDIVVESGSARYQDVVDRYMQGEEVRTDTMRDVFESTVTPTPVWDRPMYAEFFRAIRALNRVLPRDRQLRVLLGDPAIDWNVVKTWDEYLVLLRQRDSHPSGVIRREVLAKSRRALVIYGDGHLQAKTERPPLSMAAFLEAAGARVFTITTTFADLSAFQPDVTSWRVPAFALLRGTRIGAASYERFFGPPPPVPFFQGHPRIEDHFDAVLYLGPESSMTLGALSYPRCADPAYVQMRVERMVLSGMMPASVSDRLKSECEAAARK
jgi:hypothetical protein